MVFHVRKNPCFLFYIQGICKKTILTNWFGFPSIPFRIHLRSDFFAGKLQGLISLFFFFGGREREAATGKNFSPKRKKVLSTDFPPLPLSLVFTFSPFKQGKKSPDLKFSRCLLLLSQSSDYMDFPSFLSETKVQHNIFSTKYISRNFGFRAPTKFPL